MSYPPYQSGHPNPPFNGDLEFGQSMYPQAGFGFPMPSSNPPSASSNNNQNLPYSPFPPTQPSPNIPSQQIQSNFSAPYPPQSGPNISPFSSSAPSSAPYPPAGGTPAPYNPPGGSSVPFAPVGMNTSPYPPTGGASAPYAPTGPPSAPYPPGTGAGSAPYAPSMGAGSAPYPPSGPNSSPYGSSNLSSSPYPPQGSPYPPQGSPYPPSTAPPAYNPYSTSSAPPAHNPYQTSSTPSTQGIYPVASLHSASVYGSSHSAKGIATPYQERPTVRPAASFDPSSDANKLRKAMKGFGTDEAAIIQILGRRTSYQRQEIKQRYQQSFGKVEYQKLYGRPLEADLRGDTSGDFRRLMVSMASGSRDETGCDPSLAPKLAKSLYAAGAKKMGTDEVEYNRIMSTYSYCLLRQVFQEYVKVSDECINNKALFYARCLRDAMKGMGTNEKVLIRVIVCRCEIDMGNIKDEYRRAFGKRLEDSIAK
ncbi:Annexin B11 [Armadillidium vulgare]|nr:Annexin B11 [Armadillidium vulgare]